MVISTALLTSAMVTSAVVGALGAGTGSWLAWRRASALPGNEAFHTLATTAVGQPYQQRVERRDGWFEPIPTVRTLDPVLVDAWRLDASRDRLAADGWQLKPTTNHKIATSTTSTAGYGQPAQFTATRDGVRIRIDTTTEHSTSLVWVTVYPEQPGIVTTLSGLGLALGVVGGLLFAWWAARRISRTARISRWVAVVVTGVGLFAVGRPTVTAYQRVVDLFGHADTASRLPAYSGYLSRGTVAPTVLGLAAAACVVVLAAAAPRQRLKARRPSAS